MRNGRSHADLGESPWRWTGRTPVACIALLIPDRLPSLIVLAGFWVFPALAGWVAAGFAQRSSRRGVMATCAALSILVLVYATAWFLFNLGRMPPYIPGATADPTVAPPRAAASLVLVAGLLVLPGSALACALAFRHRRAVRPGPRS